jgi:predicted RNase H-like HicB family nuclease
MTEIVFQIDESPEGGYVAQAVGAAIFTQAETVEELRAMIRDAVHCHFDDPNQRPRMIRLHFVRDEVIS